MLFLTSRNVTRKTYPPRNLEIAKLFLVPFLASSQTFSQYCLCILFISFSPKVFKGLSKQSQNYQAFWVAINTSTNTKKIVFKGRFIPIFKSHLLRSLIFKVIHLWVLLVWTMSHSPKGDENALQSGRKQLNRVSVRCLLLQCFLPCPSSLLELHPPWKSLNWSIATCYDNSYPFVYYPVSCLTSSHRCFKAESLSFKVTTTWEII